MHIIKKTIKLYVSKLLIIGMFLLLFKIFMKNNCFFCNLYCMANKYIG